MKSFIISKKTITANIMMYKYKTLKKHIKRLFLFTVLLAFSNEVFSQSVTGRVIDSDRLSLPFVNIMVINQKDSSFISGAVTDSLGCFVVKNAQSGDRLIKISSIGYKTIVLPIKTDNLGIITLYEDVKTLNGVVVKGNLPKYRNISGGYSTNIAGTILSKAGTANDVLSNIPRVKGEDGLFTVFGKGNAVIYINGRKVTDGKELQQLSSQDIKSVDVLTNPGAQYDASTKSVILIKTLKKSGNGLSGDMLGNYDQSSKASTFENMHLNYRTGKLDVFGTLTYANNGGITDQKLTHEITAADKVQENVLMKERGRHETVQGETGFNITLNDSNSIGAKYKLTKTTPREYDRTSENSIELLNGKNVGSIDYLLDTDYSLGPNHAIDAYYDGKFGKMGINLNSTILLQKTSTSSLNKETSKELGDRIVTTDNCGHSNLFAVKLVMSYPFNNYLKLDFGSEYTSSQNKQIYNNKEELITSSNDKVKEHNIAGFASLAMNYGKWSLNTGLRYEHVDQNYYNHGIKVDNQSRVYNQLFPNISLAYETNSSQFELSYTAKANRPNYNMLSNYVSYDSRHLYEGGNPLLKTTIEHTLEFSYTHSWLNFAMDYEYRRNPILSWARIYDNTNNIVLLTTENIDKIQTLLATVSATPVINFWHPSLQLNFQRQFVDSRKYGIDENLNHPYFEIAFDSKFALKNNWIFGAKYDYVSNFHDDFANVGERQMFGVYINKSFLNDRLSVRLNGNNLFKSRRKLTLYMPNYILHQDAWDNSRRISLSVSYRFNSTRSKYKGEGAGLDEQKRL